MLKGHVFSKQLFESHIFAVFMDTFLSKRCGVIKDYKNGMEVNYNGSTITIQSGVVCVRGRFIEEDTSTTITTETEDAFCKLVIEVDLDKQNTEIEFAQGTYKILKDSVGYPELIQTDIVKNNAGIYQYELASFKTSSNGISEFQDMRTYLDLQKELLKQRTITLCEKFLSDCVSLNTYLMWGSAAYQEIVVEIDTNRDKEIAIMVLQDKLNNLFNTLNEICSTCPTYSTSLTNKISNLSSCTQTARTNLSIVFDNTEVSTLVASEMSRLLQKSEANTFLPNPTNNDSLYYYVNDILTILYN